MGKRFLALGVFVVLIGCGGSGQNPEPASIPRELTLPAYRGVAEDGMEVILQYEQVGNSLQGAYYAFEAPGGEDEILTGELVGERNGDQVSITLLPTYLPNEEPIELEGTIADDGLHVHDVETPEDVVHLTPFSAPQARVATSTHAQEGLPTFSYSGEGVNGQLTYLRRPVSWRTVSLFPSVSVGDWISESNRTTEVWLCTWYNGWAWFDVYRDQVHLARLWWRYNSLERGLVPMRDPNTPAPFSEDSAALNSQRRWVRVSGFAP